MIYHNYCAIIPNAFTKAEIDEINKAAESIETMPAQVGEAVDHAMSGTEDNAIRTSEIKWFDNSVMSVKHKHFYDKAMSFVYQANMDYEWNFQVEDLENLQYTIYKAQKKQKGGFYTWHTDAGPNPQPCGRIRKLSFSIQLSDVDDYNGGNFQYLTPNDQFNAMGDKLNIDLQNAVNTVPFSGKSIGSMIIFPSFLYHQVTPVVTGTRKSMVGWVVGQKYV